MKKAAVLLPLLLSACASQFVQGRADYRAGMEQLRSNPSAARETFAEADEHLVLALDDPDLPLAKRVTATSIRARVLIELDRHPEAESLVSVKIQGFEPTGNYEGDPIGLILLCAQALDPERGFSHLVLSERWAQTARARAHMAWEEVHLLQKVGTPKAKAEAVKICERHAGQIDFDQLKKQLGN